MLGTGPAAGPRFDELLERFSTDVRRIATEARSLICELDPEVTEVVWVPQGTAGYGVGPKKLSEHYGYLALHAGHVNLGFNHGAGLPDPEELLGGPGTLMRHVRLTAPEDVRRPAIAELLVVARRERAATLSR